MTVIDRQISKPTTGAGLRRPTWKLAQYLAVVGVVFLVWQAWTIVAWLKDTGLHQITRYRDRTSASWYAARCYEGLAIVMAIAVAAYVIRGILRQRRLTFDAMFCIGGALVYWLDPGSNLAQPLFMYSSNWVNVQNWCGHMPFVVNPDCGRLPEPILFDGLLYTFGLLLFVMVLNALMRKARQRWPDISVARLVGFVFVLGMLADVALETPMYLLRLWSFPGAPDSGSVFAGSGRKYPWIEVVVAGGTFALLACVRYFRDDKGRSVVERGSDHLATRVRSILSVLALVGLLNSVWLFGGVVEAIVGLYSSPYRAMPAHIVNGMCDAPGITGTRYGPCPGSPGYRIPIR
jgi:hypothetical protein